MNAGAGPARGGEQGAPSLPYCAQQTGAVVKPGRCWEHPSVQSGCWAWQRSAELGDHRACGQRPVNSPVPPGGVRDVCPPLSPRRFFNDTWESIEMQLVFHRRRCGHWETKRHDSNHMEGRGRLRTSWGMTDCCCKQNRDFRVFPEAWVQALLGKLNRWALFSCVSQP